MRMGRLAMKEKRQVSRTIAWKRMVRDRVGGDASHDASNAVDHLCGATLTERVVEFLERYNQSVFEFG